LKQKFIALLKRFRVSEDLQGLDNDQEAIGQQLSGMCTFCDVTENKGKLSKTQPCCTLSAVCDALDANYASGIGSVVITLTGILY
jgi:hypothetical protein